MTNLKNRIYFHNLSNNGLFFFDTQQEIVVEVGRINSPDTITDIAFSPTGVLFGVSFDSLYRINRNNGNATLISALNRSDVNGLTFDSEGTLLATARGSNNIFRIIPSSGELREVSQFTNASAGDIVVFNDLFHIATTGESLDRISVIDDSTLPNLDHNVANLFGLSLGANGNLYGFSGNDIYTINTETGQATLQFDLFDDLGFISVGGAASFIESTFLFTLGAVGTDSLSGGTGRDAIFGKRGSDTIEGGNGDDFILGGLGSDSIDGQRGNDLILGQSQGDVLLGGSGNDSLLGGSGNDELQGSLGSDSLVGGSGADLINGSLGRDTLLGGIGNDTLVGGASSDILLGGSGSDLINGTVNSAGGVGERDTLTGGSGAQDRFILGARNTSTIFYRDRGSGNTSFARITDFEDVDRLFLVGSQNRYDLREVGRNTVLAVIEPTGLDTIAILDNTADLSLTSRQFVFV